MRQTNWHIITGAPCSGKTTVINEIERRGIRVIHEVARAYIDRQLGKGLRFEAYGNIGYDLIMVPVMPVKDRADMVLECIRL